MTRIGLFTLAAGAALAGGCAERRLAISSEPPGATVWVNDVEVGRTPVEVNFTHYGTYDVRLRLNGYEPVATSAKAEAPWYEFIGADLITEALPTGVTTKVEWRFTLQPAMEVIGTKEEFEANLLKRARELRSQLEPATTPATTEPQSK